MALVIGSRKAGAGAGAGAELRRQMLIEALVPWVRDSVLRLNIQIYSVYLENVARCLLTMSEGAMWRYLNCGARLTSSEIGIGIGFLLRILHGRLRLREDYADGPHRRHHHTTTTGILTSLFGDAGAGVFTSAVLETLPPDVDEHVGEHDVGVGPWILFESRAHRVYLSGENFYLLSVDGSESYDLATCGSHGPERLALEVRPHNGWSIRHYRYSHPRQTRVVVNVTQYKITLEVLHVTRREVLQIRIRHEQHFNPVDPALGLLIQLLSADICNGRCDPHPNGHLIGTHPNGYLWPGLGLAALQWSAPPEPEPEPEPGPEPTTRSWCGDPINDFVCRHWMTVFNISAEVEDLGPNLGDVHPYSKPVCPADVTIFRTLDDLARSRTLCFAEDAFTYTGRRVTIGGWIADVGIFRDETPGPETTLVEVLVRSPDLRTLTRGKILVRGKRVYLSLPRVRAPAESFAEMLPALMGMFRGVDGSDPFAGLKLCPVINLDDIPMELVSFYNRTMRHFGFKRSFNFHFEGGLVDCRMGTSLGYQYVTSITITALGTFLGTEMGTRYTVTRRADGRKELELQIGKDGSFKIMTASPEHLTKEAFLIGWKGGVDEKGVPCLIKLAFPKDPYPGTGTTRIVQSKEGQFNGDEQFCKFRADRADVLEVHRLGPLYRCATWGCEGIGLYTPTPVRDDGPLFCVPCSHVEAEKKVPLQLVDFERYVLPPGSGDHKEKVVAISPIHATKTRYVAGEKVVPEGTFSTEITDCACPGIYFFLTRDRLYDYVFRDQALVEQVITGGAIDMGVISTEAIMEAISTEPVVTEPVVTEQGWPDLEIDLGDGATVMGTPDTEPVVTEATVTKATDTEQGWPDLDIDLGDGEN